MKAILVDDEQNARLALSGLLTECFPQVEVVAECRDVPEAVKAIHKEKPDVVFLDISMPGYSGLELVQFFDEQDRTFAVIFVTAYSEYALNAFELSAVDYLLKPVRREALERALQKASNSVQSLTLLRENLEGNRFGKVALATGDGMTFVSLESIVYLKADGSYTHFVMDDGRRHTVTKKLAEFERLEQMGDFMRIHRSHLVNLHRVVKLLKQDGGTLVMDNGDQLSVSAERKSMLMARFGDLKL